MTSGMLLDSLLIKDRKHIGLMVWQSSHRAKLVKENPMPVQLGIGILPQMRTAATVHFMDCMGIVIK